MNDFYRTGMGQHFFNRTVPNLVEQLARLNDLLERLVTRADALASVRCVIYTRSVADPPVTLEEQRAATEAHVRRRGGIFVVVSDGADVDRGPPPDEDATTEG